MFLSKGCYTIGICLQPFSFNVSIWNRVVQARVVQRPDNAIHWIIYYPADSVVCFVNIYPLDSDLSGG